MKYPVLILVLVGLLRFAAFSQNNEKQFKHSLSVFYHPEYCYRILYSKDVDINSLYGSELSLYDSERPVFGYTTGALLRTNIRKRWLFTTGLELFKMGFTRWPTVGYGWYHWGSKYSSPFPEARLFKKTFTGLGIPLLLGFKPYYNKHFSIDIGIGAIPAYVFIKEKEYNAILDDYYGYMLKGESRLSRRIYFFFPASVNFKYSYRHWQIGIGAEMKIKPYSDEYIKEYLYSAGGGLELGFQF